MHLFSGKFSNFSVMLRLLLMIFIGDKNCINPSSWREKKIDDRAAAINWVQNPEESISVAEKRGRSVMDSIILFPCHANAELHLPSKKANMKVEGH